MVDHSAIETQSDDGFVTTHGDFHPIDPSKPETRVRRLGQLADVDFKLSRFGFALARTLGRQFSLLGF